MSMTMTMTRPQRQIRADYNIDTITVYQAYSAEIANAAVQHQKLDASPSFSTARMTWIKPSWTWMMYRSAYSYKDSRQTNILALTMRREHFVELLSHARLAYQGSGRTTGARVIVQWDPERGPRLERLDHRSIQIGVSREICEEWIDKWIVGIEDVTWRARGMKSLLDEDASLGVDGLVERGLMPVEKPFEVPHEIQRRLDMLDDVPDVTNVES